jgi:hypothetical protein
MSGGGAEGSCNHAWFRHSRKGGHSGSPRMLDPHERGVSADVPTTLATLPVYRAAVSARWPTTGFPSGRMKETLTPSRIALAMLAS